MFRILIFYKTDDALDEYLHRFRFAHPDCLTRKSKNDRLYLCDGVQIVCVKGLGVNFKGMRADFIAVQEELSWRDTWEQIRDCILDQMVCSPIPIHIFDGISDSLG